MPTFTCPSCSSHSVEKIPINSQLGRNMIKKIRKARKDPVFLYKLNKIESSNSKYIFFYHCFSCDNWEIWNVKKKELLLRKFIAKKFIDVSQQKHDIFVGVMVSLLCIFIAMSLLFHVEAEGYLKIQDTEIKIFPSKSLDIFTLLYIIGLSSGFTAFISLLTYILMNIIDKNIKILKFTFNLHDISYAKHLYFLEYHPKTEKINILASLKRAIYGTLLMLGIGVMIIENFLTIPDLKPFFLTASIITLISLGFALPFIIIFLYISPLITKEINLYYYNKDDRVIKNVGAWLDNSLQFFAVIDIILTIVIMTESDLPKGWFLIIIALVLIAFSLFFLLTIIFNRFFHSRIKEKFRQYMMGNYHLPIRKIGTFQQHYYCWNCGKETDYVQRDTCSHCGEEIHKCCICNEIIDINNPIKKDNKDDENKDDKLHSIIEIMESKMSGGPGMELPYIECPYCHSRGHIDEFLSWLKLRQTCPVCKEHLEYKDLF
ncbi:MAG: hypothetical protein ACTSVI_10665 [Promethearchaeota archaeon]